MSMASTTRRTLFPKRYADFVQKLRVAFGFALLLTFAFFCGPSPGSLMAGIPLAIAGLGLRAWAAGHLAKNENLATGGPYSFVRNPLYVGTLLVALGIVLASRSLFLAVIAAVAFLFVYLPVIELEEQHLRSIFPLYAPYAERVYRFLPFRRWPAAQSRFSMALYRRNQEWKAAAGFAAALCWMLLRLRIGAILR